MRALRLPVPLAILAAGLTACGDSGATGPRETGDAATASPEDAGGDGHGEEDHTHDETPLGSVRIGEFEVELAQGHGPVVAGEEAHLVVKLPCSDQGSTVVRAWLGTKDRTLSYVGKGEYAPSHDDYDVHATAPDPLPENLAWWIELELPDGTKVVGSAPPLLP